MHINDDHKYTQSVHKLAHGIIYYTDRDFAATYQESKISAEDMEQHILTHPELQLDWESLDIAADAIVSMYHISHENLMIDVWEAMTIIDATSTKTVN